MKDLKMWMYLSLFTTTELQQAWCSKLYVYDKMYYGIGKYMHADNMSNF